MNSRFKNSTFKRVSLAALVAAGMSACSGNSGDDSSSSSGGNNGGSTSSSSSSSSSGGGSSTMTGSSGVQTSSSQGGSTSGSSSSSGGSSSEMGGGSSAQPGSSQGGGGSSEMGGGSSQMGGGSSNASGTSNGGGTSGTSQGGGGSSTSQGGGGSSTSQGGTSQGGGSSSGSTMGNSSSAMMVDRGPVCAPNAVGVLTPGTPANGMTAGTTSYIDGCTFGTFTVGAGAPEQVWRLEVPQASGVTITVDATFDSAVYLLSGSTCQQATLVRPDACTDTEGNPEVLALDLVPAGTYFVVVDGFEDATGAVSSGSYTITATLQTGGMCLPDFLDDPEPANTLDLAARVVGSILDEAGAPDTVSLTLCGADEDWIVFFAQSTVTVRATPAVGFAGVVSAAVSSVSFSAEGTPTGTPYTNGVSTQNNVTTITNPPVGTYAVRFTASGTGMAGMRYDLGLLHACEPDELEGDTGDNTAADVSSGFGRDVPAGAFTARVCPADVDHLLFNSPGAGTATITLTGAAALAVTPLGIVRDSMGAISGTTMNPPGITGSVQGSNRVFTWTVTPGAQVLLRVEGGQGAVPAAGTAYGVVVDFPDLNNDLCQNALQVTLPPVGGQITLTGDTTEYGSERSASGNCVNNGHTGMPQPDAYYTFTPTTAVRLQVAVLTTSYDSVMYLIQGDCSSMNQVACNDDLNAQNGLNSGFQADLVAGQRYTLVVDSFEDGAPFQLGIATAAIPPP